MQAHSLHPVTLCTPLNNIATLPLIQTVVNWSQQCYRNDKMIKASDRLPSSTCLLQNCQQMQNLQDLNSRTFQGFSSTFNHLICFQALSRALKFLFQIQAFSRISQAHYEPCIQCGSLRNLQNNSSYRLLAQYHNISTHVPFSESTAGMQWLNCKIKT